MTKRDKNNESINYNEATQKLYLEYLLTSQTDYVRCQSIIRPEYWDSKFRPACRFIMEYSDKFKSLPNTDLVYAETGVDLVKHDPIEISQYSQWLLQSVEQFCRHKANELLILEGPELLEKGLYAEIERRSKENNLISLQKDMGTDYLDDPKSRLEAMKDRKNQITTGWKDIDKQLYGGFERGQLNIWAGGPGSGKSLFLQNYALNLIHAGLDVVYITLELSEDLVALRFDAMNSGVGTRDIFKKIDDVSTKIAMLSKKNKWGKLTIKKFPEAGTNANDIRAYLKEYEILNGKKPDGLVVDYLDLLHPNSAKIDAANLFTKDKYTSEELRALSGELNLLTATASQLNRASVQEADFDHSHIAGGISKINTADNVMGIYASASMKEQGRYQIQFLKTRSSSGVGNRVELQFNKESLRITDAEGTGYYQAPSENMSSSSELQEQIAKTKLRNNPSEVEQERKVTKLIDEESVEKKNDEPAPVKSNNIKELMAKLHRKP